MRKRGRINKGYIITFGFAIILIATFVISLVATPGTTNNISDIEDFDPLPTIPPTQIPLPTPEPDGPNLTLRALDIQSNGLFQVTVPNDWEIAENRFNPAVPRARITYDSPINLRYSVIDVILDFGINYPSHEALSTDYLTTTYFRSEWSAEYQGMLETSRTVGDTITIDFELAASGQGFLARQVSWLDNGWLHSVRAVVPSNNPLLLDALIDMIVPTFVSYNDQRETDFSWTAYTDSEQGFLIRYPNWQESARSLLTATDLPAQARLRTILAQPLAALEDAEAFVMNTLRPGSEVLSSQVTEREYGSGYLVSFSDVDSDGNPVSGMAALLNDDAGDLYVADIRLEEPTINLLSLEADSPYQQLRDVLDTFMILPGGNQRVIPAETPPTFDIQLDITREPTDEQ